MKTDKMRRRVEIISMLCLILTGFVLANPVRKTIEVDGFEREYMVYTPSSHSTEKAGGIIVCLHGFGRNMDDFFEEYDVTGIADLLNMIVVAPQALPEQHDDVNGLLDTYGPLIGNGLSLHSVWGCGLGVEATLLFLQLINAELNKDLDDVNFIDRMIDEVISDFDMPEENIYMLGTSMGGYMTYQYALLNGDRLSGIISIAGSMGTKIKGMDHHIKVPVCDFHSLTDEVVHYNGPYMEEIMGWGLLNISLATPMEQVINYWRETNGTGDPVTEKIDYYPSTNGITVEKFTYPEPDYEVIHYRIDGAPHSYFFSKDNGDCMDHAEEIMRFIQAHTTDNPNNNPVIPRQKAFFYPNPAYDMIYTSVTNGIVTVYDITGRSILSQSFTEGRVDLSSLKSGIYIIRIQSGDIIHTGKLIKK